MGGPADGYLPKIVFDFDKRGTPEVLTVDGEPFPIHPSVDVEPEVTILLSDEDGDFGYIAVGLIGHIEVRGEGRE